MKKFFIIIIDLLFFNTVKFSQPLWTALAADLTFMLPNNFYGMVYSFIIYLWDGL